MSEGLKQSVKRKKLTPRAESMFRLIVQLWQSTLQVSAWSFSTHKPIPKLIIMSNYKLVGIRTSTSTCIITRATKFIFVMFC